MVGASHHLLSDVGDFRIAARSKRAHLPRVEEAIAGELAAFKRGEVSEQEIADAKKTIIGRHALAMESNYAHAFALIEYTHLPGAQEPEIADFDSAINGVTGADLQRAANTYFVPERSYVVIYDPICTANQLAIFAVVSTALAGLSIALRRRRRAQVSAARRSADHDQRRRHMNDLAKLIIGVGLLLVAAGAGLLLLGKLGIHPGRLPGDIHVEGGRSSFHFPVVTCLVVSVVLTVLLNLIGKFWR